MQATAISRAAILCRDSAALGQRAGSSLLIDLPHDEMALLIEIRCAPGRDLS
jgi:hypothetical protein